MIDIQHVNAIESCCFETRNLKGFQDVVERKFLGINDGIFLEFSGAMGKLSLAEATWTQHADTPTQFL